MNKSLPRLAAVGLVAATATLALLASPDRKAAATNDRAAAQPLAVNADSTRLLTLELDADGVRVLQTVTKPGLRYVAPPMAAARRPFGWTLHATDGTELARGGFDPAKLCLDPTHRGQAPHIEGCVVVPHTAHCNVRIPALADAARIDFHQHGAGATPRRLASVARADWMEVR